MKKILSNILWIFFLFSVYFSGFLNAENEYIGSIWIGIFGMLFLAVSMQLED
jgi:hypothetical protein